MRLANILLFLTLVALMLSQTGCGRNVVNPGGATIHYQLPSDFAKIISVGSTGDSNGTMLTYETTHGELVTKEYQPGGLFAATIQWEKPVTTSTSTASPATPQSDEPSRKIDETP